MDTAENAPLIKGPNILLLGPAGTGKTWSLGTLVEWAETRNFPVFVLFTESGLETLLLYFRTKNKPIPANLHWNVIDTAPTGLADLVKAAENIGKMSYEQITKMVDPNRNINNPWLKIMQHCFSPVCARTGKVFPSLDKWPSTHIFVMDGLTETSNAAMKMCIGAKPTAAPSDYGMAQNNLMNFLRLLCNAVHATVVLIGHLTREKDEMTGGIKLMPRTIGAAIAGDIAPLFSEVILAVREGDKWYWDTANSMADLKSRYLPYGSRHAPTFETIMTKWEALNYELLKEESRLSQLPS